MNKSIVLIKLMERAWARWVREGSLPEPMAPILGIGVGGVGPGKVASRLWASDPCLRDGHGDIQKLMTSWDKDHLLSVWNSLEESSCMNF